MTHFVSPLFADFRCRCGRPAAHRVQEDMTFDHPELLTRRPLTAILCCDCFRRLFRHADCGRGWMGEYQI